MAALCAGIFEGLYKKVAEGKIKGFTGVDAPYEAPENPEIHIKTHESTIKNSANIIIRKLGEVGINLPRTFREIDTTEPDVCTPKKE